MIRKATIDDVAAMHELINDFASRHKLLPRSLGYLYTHIRDFHVWVDSDQNRIAGCCALHLIWKDLAEIKSLVVRRERQRKGIGRSLVLSCLEEARSFRIERIFVLTYEVRFFENLGFHVVDKTIFPQKIWADCLNCSKFPECDETALVWESQYHDAPSQRPAT